MLLPFLLLTAAFVQDTSNRATPPDSYADARTADLVRNTRAARERNERLVTSYTATVSQRIGVGVRALSRDRMLYRQELAAKISWKRDGKSTIELTGAREGIPVAYRNDQIPDDLNDVRSLVVNPAEDYLRVTNADNEGFIYPLRDGGERDYKFAAGDSTVIAMPGGKRVRLVELRVIPRRSDWKLIGGSLWFDADSYGMVRALFKPARPFELRRDLDAEDKKDVPEWVNASGEVKFVTMEYGLYENRWWMLRYTAIDAAGSMGSWLGMPIKIERVYADYEVEGGTPPDPNSKFRPAGTIARQYVDSAGVPLDSAARKARSDSISKAIDQCVEHATSDDSMKTRGGRREVRIRVGRCTRRQHDDSVLTVIVPADTASLLTSPTLGPPILAMGDLISESEIRSLAQGIPGLPKAPWATSLQLPKGVGTLLQHARYNRVEALSLGTGGRVDFGRFRLDGAARIGVADWWPNVEVSAATRPRNAQLQLGAYRRLTAANPDTHPFGLMNSFFGLVAHRDDGQYYRTQGAEFIAQNTNSGWWTLRLYAERQTAARVETTFSIPHLFGSDGVFQPNITADRATQAGGSLTVRGARTFSKTFTLSSDVSVDGAGGDYQFGRGAATVRGLITPDGPIAVALSASAGTSTGTLPIQSRFYLGGPATLRGYDGGSISGQAFWAGRAEVANSFPGARIALFSDVGWAGPRPAFSRGKALIGGGVGASFLDGLIRTDLSHAFNGARGWRFDIYFDGIL